MIVKAPHGFTAETTIVISGCSLEQANGTWTVTPNPLTPLGFIWTGANVGNISGFGGRWDYPP